MNDAVNATAELAISVSYFQFKAAVVVAFPTSLTGKIGRRGCKIPAIAGNFASHSSFVKRRSVKSNPFILWVIAHRRTAVFHVANFNLGFSDRDSEIFRVSALIEATFVNIYNDLKFN